MEPARVSGIVTVEDERSYINITTLHRTNPIEIHSALSEVCGEFTVDFSSVSHWANCFCLKTATPICSVPETSLLIKKQ